MRARDPCVLVRQHHTPRNNNIPAARRLETARSLKLSDDGQSHCAVDYCMDEICQDSDHHSFAPFCSWHPVFDRHRPSTQNLASCWKLCLAFMSAWLQRRCRQTERCKNSFTRSQRLMHRNLGRRLSTTRSVLKMRLAPSFKPKYSSLTCKAGGSPTSCALSFWTRPKQEMDYMLTRLV